MRSATLALATLLAWGLFDTGSLARAAAATAGETATQPKPSTNTIGASAPKPATQKPTKPPKKAATPTSPQRKKASGAAQTAKAAKAIKARKNATTRPPARVSLAAASPDKPRVPAAAAASAAGAASVAAVAATAPTSLSGWVDRPEAHELVERLARDAQIPVAWTREQLNQAQRSTRVQQLIAPPPRGTAKDWAAYRARFVEPKRIQAGAEFWRTHERWLSQAQSRWGVPAEVIVGIVGVETFYGRMTGGFRALDALATLAFDYPEGGRNRSAFFLGELEALLKLAWQQQVGAADYRGSFAGALGLPQFMPSSILKWAVDFDGDGHIQLHDSPPDVIGSVANFLKEHGWQEGLAPTFPASPPTDTQDKAVLLAPDIRPSFSAGQMRERGAVLASTVPDSVGPLALVELQNGELAPSYVAGTTNFYALTRYNQSSYYAMAVLALGQAVKSAVAPGSTVRDGKP